MKKGKKKQEHYILYCNNNYMIRFHVINSDK